MNIYDIDFVFLEGMIWKRGKMRERGRKE